MRNKFENINSWHLVYFNGHINDIDNNPTYFMELSDVAIIGRCLGTYSYAALVPNYSSKTCDPLLDSKIALNVTEHYSLIGVLEKPLDKLTDPCMITHFKLVDPNSINEFVAFINKEFINKNSHTGLKPFHILKSYGWDDVVIIWNIGADEFNLELKKDLYKVATKMGVLDSFSYLFFDLNFCDLNKNNFVTLMSNEIDIQVNNNFKVDFISLLKTPLTAPPGQKNRNTSVLEHLKNELGDKKFSIKPVFGEVDFLLEPRQPVHREMLIKFVKKMNKLNDQDGFFVQHKSLIIPVEPSSKEQVDEPPSEHLPEHVS